MGESGIPETLPGNMRVLEQAYSKRYGLSEMQTQKQLESISARRLLSLLADEAGLLDRAVLEDLEARERDLKDRERALAAQRVEVGQNAQAVLETATDLAETRKQNEQRAQELKELEQQLLTLELPESRDRLRLFRIYLDQCKPETDRNRTYWLAGCASILAGAPVTTDIKIQSMDEKRKELGT